MTRDRALSAQVMFALRELPGSLLALMEMVVYSCFCNELFSFTVLHFIKVGPGPVPCAPPTLTPPPAAFQAASTAPLTQETGQDHGLQSKASAPSIWVACELTCSLLLTEAEARGP